MKRIFFIIILLSAIAQGFAGESLRDSAASWYQQDRFDKAIDAWESILEAEGECAELYYNLGNAYFKLDDTGKSILYYERARLLSPEDDDIQHNLEIARAQIADRVEAIPDLFFIVWLNALNRWISGTAWGVFSIILFLSVLGISLWRLFRHKIRGNKLLNYTVINLLIFSGITLLLALRADKMTKQSNEAIIMEDVLVKSSPAETGTNLFEIHEGLKVEIKDSVNSFYEIRLSDGKVGWIRAGTLKDI
ncbi:MAG: tetratricopeptide repeat protein [Bacteroidales bacterium]|jgi:tetratricopeptide (TPR) repeat protein|nr:tetratricopeptide repeat protein [Bacteroidales bacterium]